MSTSAQSVKPTIVLIHGLWLTPKSWEGWIRKFEQAGYKVLAPAWPGMEGDVETIRKNPAALRGMRLMTVVDHYDRIVRGLDAPPILMGHSFGGLIVQLLVDRGLGAAGVVIDSAQSAGVPVLPLSTVRATLSILGNPFTFNKAVSLTPSQFNYAFTNELDATESKKVYDRLAVPGPARILWDGAFSLLNPQSTIYLLFLLPVRAIYFLPLMVATTVLFILMPSNDHVAHGAHLGGILAGVAWVKLGWHRDFVQLPWEGLFRRLRRWKPLQSRQQAHEQRHPFTLRELLQLRRKFRRQIER